MNRSRSNRSRLIAAVVAPLLVALLTGCGEAPAEVLANAQQAAESKDIDAYLGWFTERSAKLLRGLHEVSEETRGRYEYLPKKDFFALLPKGDVQEETEEDNLYILRVGKSAKSAEEVFLLRETDGWRIDIYDSPRFWKPLTVKPSQ